MGNVDNDAPAQLHRNHRRVRTKTDLMALWQQRLDEMNNPAPKTGAPEAIRAAIEEAYRARNRR